MSVDPLPTPQIDGVAWEQLVIGNTVYVGGNFSSARPFGAPKGEGERPRANFLAYDLHSGELLPFAPSFDAQVRTLAVSPDGTRLYVGGLFQKVDGVSRYRVAAFDVASGALVPEFRPYVNSYVKTLVVTDTTVFVGGNFKTVAQRTGGPVPAVARTYAAAFTTSDATVLPWSPRIVGEAQVESMVISPDETKIVLGGAFRNLNGSSNPGYTMGATDTITGTTVLKWNVNGAIPKRSHVEKYDVSVYSLKSDGEFVYGVMGPAAFEGTFKASWTDGALAPGWIADCHGDTYDVEPVGDVVYTASHAHDCGNVRGFEDYVAPSKWYRALAFTDAATQKTRKETAGYQNYEGLPAPTLLNWYPDFDIGPLSGQGPWTITSAQGFVLYGGEFRKIGSTKQQGLTRFATAAVAPNKNGPALSGADMKPTLTSFLGTHIKLTWPSNYDRDNEYLTYQVIRDDDFENPVFETTRSSRFWERTTLHGNDGRLAPGTTHTYRIRTVDPFGNSTVSEPAAYTVTGAVPLAWTPYDRAVLQDQPSAYWPMNEAGKAAYDWAGSSHLTSITTPRVAGVEASPAARAGSFNGVNTYAASSVRLAAKPTFSQEAWIKTTTKRGGVLMGMSTSRTTANDSFDRQLYMANTGQVYFASIDSGAVKTVNSTSRLNDGKWHHVVATVGAAGARLYVDGALQSSRTDQRTGAPLVAGAYWHVGAHQLTGRPAIPASIYFAGTIDNVAAYDRPLTAAEVKAHYQAGTAPAPNARPTASFAPSLSNLSAAVDASASVDPDGAITSYEWDFGDGTTGSGVKVSHDYAGSGVYTVALRVTDDRGATATTTRPITVTRPGILAEDLFARSVDVGWGSTPFGGDWVAAHGASGLSVIDGSGTMTAGPGQTRSAVLSGVSSTAVDVRSSFSIAEAPSGGGQSVSVVGRQVGADYYAARVLVRATGDPQLQILRSGTTIKTVTLTGAAYKPGEVVNVRVQVTGTGTSTVSAMAWTGATEPSSWQLSVTDSTATLQQAGSVGVRFYLSASALASTVIVRDFSAGSAG
ncbi:LamG-like jellyroll fold domain-containing protein [Labedella phragmitis]|uniref:LamG-like jellyroll fold domain-containing protein n=1 Tax=Labedella phragmitis TaxID=2498849 RepID=UPI00140CD826|nr:LamG-like jellyroll fold domain-containing protein [Labedella phragmitis]